MQSTLAHLLSAAALVASAASAQAAQVNISGWAYGHGNNVFATAPTGTYGGPAGAVVASVSGLAALELAPFYTYSLELEEGLRFSSYFTQEYAVVDGASYFQTRRGEAAIADRLGRLMTYAYENPDLVESSDGSTALQLAVWNTVYDVDFTVATEGRFSDASAYQATADVLLAGAREVLRSRYEVVVLERQGNTDFLMLKANPQRAEVPEPGSLLLVGAALAGLVAAGRRRA